MKKDAPHPTLTLISIDLGWNKPGLPPPKLPLGPIKPSFMHKDFLSDLERQGIPVCGPHPFGIAWALFVRRLKDEGKGFAASWVADLVLAEWDFVRWNELFLKHGCLEDLEVKEEAERYIETKGSSIGGGPRTSDLDLNERWFLDDLVVKIRAVWDKIPRAILKSSPIIPEEKKEFKGVKHGARLNELNEIKKHLGLSQKGMKLLDRLLEEATPKKIEYVDEYRTGVVHLQTKRSAEVLGLRGEDESLAKRWSSLKSELNRAREANLATIYLIFDECNIIEREAAERPTK
jgi:hypothetical protein